LNRQSIILPTSYVDNNIFWIRSAHQYFLEIFVDTCWLTLAINGSSFRFQSDYYIFTTSLNKNIYYNLNNSYLILFLLTLSRLGVLGALKSYREAFLPPPYFGINTYARNFKFGMKVNKGKRSKKIMLNNQ